MATATAESEPAGVDSQRLILEGVPWEEYLGLSAILVSRRVRLTYDRGTLEVMTLSMEHERHAELLARLVVLLCAQLGYELASGGRTTFRRRLKERGLEPDSCFWVAREPALRGRVGFDPELDPGPDLAIEVEISRTLMDRIGIYAALGVPEIWRYDVESLTNLRLATDGTYAEVDSSLSFPGLPTHLLPRWVAYGLTQGETRMFHDFMAWVRAGMPSDQVP